MSDVPARAAEACSGGISVGLYAAAVALVVLGGLGALAELFRQPLLFPSLGPTVLVLAERPRSASAHPRNVMLGHGIGVGVGLLSLLVFGLLGAPAAVDHAPSLPRTGAVIMSLGTTTLLLQVLRMPHAPAGATTLIISLGLLRTASDVLAVLAAIAFVTAVATALNLATGRRRTLRTGRDRGRIVAADDAGGSSCG